MTDLPTLAVRVEAEPPSRELADEVLLACGYRLDTDSEHKDIWIAPNRHKYAVFYRLGDPRSNPLTSLDTAKDLVPEGLWWEIRAIDTPSASVFSKTQGQPDSVYETGKAWGHGTPKECWKWLPAALTAACLRARAAMEEKT